MKTRKTRKPSAFPLVILLACACADTSAQVTAFNYQGFLARDGEVANGSYDLKYSLFDRFNQQVGSTVFASGTTVSNGLFTTTLDFGSVPFNGQSLWLDVGVRRTGSVEEYSALRPRRTINATPYAIYAITASTLSGVLPADKLPPNVAFLDRELRFDRRIVFGGGIEMITTNRAPLLNADMLDGLHGADFWQTRGNSGTTPGTHFVGTTDSKALELKANNTRVLRLETQDSIAGGSRARVTHSGTFVWADGRPFDFASTNTDQFRVRAVGGVDFITAVENGTGNPTASVKMTGSGGVSIWSSANTNPALELRRGSIKVTGAGVNTATPAFIHRVTAATRQGKFSVMDHPLCNNDPNAVLIVTPNLNPGDTTGLNVVFDSSPVGVFYTGTSGTTDATKRNKWAIYALNTTNQITVNAAFNVMVIKP